MRPLRHALRWLAVLLALGIPDAFGITTTWQQPATGDWFDPASWDAGVPQRLDDAIIANGGTADIDAGSPLFPPGLDLEVLTLDVGAGAAGAVTPAGSVVVTDTDLSVIGATWRIGSATGDNLGANGEVSTTNGDLFAGGSLIIGQSFNNNIAGVSASGDVDVDGSVRAGFTVGSASTGNTATGTLVTSEGLETTASASVAAANGGSAAGTVTLTGGDFTINQALFIAQTTSFTPGGSATGVVDIPAGSLVSAAGAFNRDITIGRAVTGTADGRLTAASVDTSGLALGDIYVGFAADQGSAVGLLRFDSGDVAIDGDVHVAETSLLDPGPSSAEGSFTLNGRIDSAGGGDEIMIGLISAGGLFAAGNGSATGTATMLGAGGFDRFGVGVARGTVFNTAAVDGTATVGAGGISLAGGGSLQVGYSFGQRNNNQVFGDGAVVSGALDIDQGSVSAGSVVVGVSDIFGDATGMLTMQGGDLIASGSVSIGTVVSNNAPVVVDATDISADGTMSMTGGRLQAGASLIVGSAQSLTELTTTTRGVLTLQDTDVDVGGLLSVGAGFQFDAPATESYGTVSVSDATVSLGTALIGNGQQPVGTSFGSLSLTRVDASVEQTLSIGFGGAADGVVSLTDSTLAVGDDLAVGGGLIGAPAKGRLDVVRSQITTTNLRVGPGSPAHGDGRLTLTDSTLTASGFASIGSSSNAGAFVGESFLTLDRSQLVVGARLQLDVDSTLTLTIDGTNRGTEFGAIDAESLLLGDFSESLNGTTLNIVFDSTPDVDAFDFDLIVTSLADGINTDFETLSITGLDPDFSAVPGIVVDDLGAGPVEIYRLALTRVNFRGCNDNSPASGVMVECSDFDNVGVTADPGSSDIVVEVLGGVDVEVDGTAMTLRTASALANAGTLTGRANALPAVLLEGDDNLLETSGDVIATGAGSPAIVSQGTGNTVRILAAGSVDSTGASAIVGAAGSEAVEVYGTVAGAGGIAVDLGAGEDRFLLAPGAQITGAVAAGADTDSFVLGGDGQGRFDLGTLGPGQAFRDFELFSKDGPSSWTLAGTGTGAWSVLAGTLIVAGEIGGAVDVAPGGRLGGTGLVGALTNAGTVAPGNSIGTLTVAGDYTHATSAIYEVEVNAAGAGDLIDVTGSASIAGGTVAVLAEYGSYAPSTDYTILRATGGVSGRFDTVTSNLAFLSPALSYLPDSVLLTLTRNATNYADVARTFNQRRVAAALDADSQAATGDYQTLFEALQTLTEPAAREAFDALSGEIHPGVHRAMLRSSEQFLASVRRSASLAGGRARVDVRRTGTSPAAGAVHRNAWLTVLGAEHDFDDDGNAAGIDYDEIGLAAGVDFAPAASWRLGAAAGYTAGDVDNTRRAGAELDGVHAAVYGVYRRARLEMDGILAWARQEVETDCDIDIAALSRRALADYDADVWSASVEARYGLARGDRPGLVEPYAGFTWVHVDGGTVSETGAGSLALAARLRGTDSARLRAGFRAAGQWQTGIGLDAVPMLHLGVAHQLGDVVSVARSRFPGPGGSADFEARGASGNRNEVEIGIGLSAAAGERLSLHLGLEGILGEASRTYAANATLQLRW